MSSDADLLREVFAVAKEFGLTIVTVRAGAIELRVTQAVRPIERPITSQMQEVKDIRQQSDDEALPELRKRSKAQFGYVKPDELLLQWKDIL